MLTAPYFFIIVIDVLWKSDPKYLKKKTKRLRPKFAICNEKFIGQIDIADIRKMKFIDSQMFSQVHSIGYLVEFFQETMNKFALQHVFDFQPMNLFSEYGVRSVFFVFTTVHQGIT